MNWDFTNVDLDNKQERSIFIGIQQTDNENLSSFLINSADSLVRYYLENNGVSEEETIITQRDGFIITKILENTDEFISMKFRGHISPLIISIDRLKYISIIDEEVIVKGVSHIYPALNLIYQKFSNLNFFNKKILFSQLNSIKNSFINNDNKELFMIPHEDKFAIITKKLGNLIVQNSELFDIEDINRKYYYEHYFMPFFKSIFLEYY
jgi:hypothetical protein